MDMIDDMRRGRRPAGNSFDLSTVSGSATLYGSDGAEIRGLPVVNQSDVGINTSVAHARAITPANTVVVEQTTALVVGGGSAADTYLLGIVILKNATAVTVAVAGFADEDGDAKTMTFTGSTTDDVVRDFGCGLINAAGPLTVTASVGDKVMINYWAAV